MNSNTYNSWIQKYDLPMICNNLGKKPFLTRCFISPDGDIYNCFSDINHIVLSRKIVYENYIDEYFKINPYIFDKKPNDMLQEEYFLLIIKKFVKITYNNIDNFLLISYYNLSPNQINIIYPK